MPCPYHDGQPLSYMMSPRLIIKPYAHIIMASPSHTMSPRLVKFEPRHPQGIEASAKGEERPKGKGEVDGCAA